MNTSPIDAIRLLALTEALARTLTEDDVARAAIGFGMEAVGASAAAVSRVSEDGSHVELVASEGLSGSATSNPRFPLATPSAMSDAIRTATPVLFSTRADREAAYPALAAVRALIGQEAMAVLPLNVEGVVRGAITFYFPGSRLYPEDGRSFLLAVAAQVAQAMERARLYRAEQLAREEARAAREIAEAAHRRAAFLAEASALLSESLDHERTLRRIAELAVPALADWCAVDLFGPGPTAVRVAAVHQDPARVALAHEVQRRWPSDLSREQGLGAILRGGPGELIPVITEEMLETIPDLEYRRIIRELGLRSVVIAPISIQDRPLGAISLIYAESGRAYTKDDFDTAVQLGRRAGLALENARLYRSEQEAHAQAREADRRKDEFLAMLGHELRNPLAPITTALHLIRLKVDAGIDRELAIIDRQVGHLTRLVDDLLDLSRITRGKVQLTRERVELASIIAKAIELAGPLIEQRQHRLSLEVPHRIAVEGDPTRLAQVFANLLNNAAKYTDAGGRIEIVATPTGDAVDVTVRDNGIGIPQDLLARVFERFVQAEQSKDRAQGGLGIGLALVRSLVDLHGGSVGAESDGPGKGSTFRVRLPMSDAAPRDAAPPEARPPVPRAERAMRVLVVDDLEDVRLPLAEALREHGHEIAMAHDGPSALAEAQRFQPEAAIVDIGLPVMDGYELAQRLRERMPGLRLLAVTGYGQETDREKSREAGFERHFVKPVSPDELLRALAGQHADRDGGRQPDGNGDTG